MALKKQRSLKDGENKMENESGRIWGWGKNFPENIKLSCGVWANDKSKTPGKKRENSLETKEKGLQKTAKIEYK
ncbi:MAG: hypothetical protein CM15mV108_110 [uncultured marine virus]|nr:MAG: hypothetical protein CM15mV108_110 [uncultured marine virus]